MPPPVLLTGTQKNNLHAIVENPHLAPAFALRGQNNPNVRVFMANFDGTFNDKDRVPSKESKTLVALTHESAEAHNSDTFVSHYSNGVGTGKGISKVRSGFEGLSGNGCEDRAENMHRELIFQSYIWKKNNPDAIIHVCATGFSRGGATALHFLNLVHERGASPANIAPDRAQTFVDMGLGPGDIKSSALLLDVVATGQEKVLKLALPPSTQSCLHLIAGGEERRLFKLHQLSNVSQSVTALGEKTNRFDNHEWAHAKNVLCPETSTGSVPYTPDNGGSFFYHRLKETLVAGARHSDVGGAYVKDGMAGIPGYLSKCFLQSLGIPGMTAVKPQMETIQSAMATDSRDSLETTMQRMEELVGFTHRRESVSRLTARAIDRPWDGDIFRSVQITLFDENQKEIESRKIRMVAPHKEGEKIPSDAFLKKQKTMKYVSSNDDIMQSMEGFQLDKDKKTLSFRGVRIDDMDEYKPIVDHIFKKTPGVIVLIEVKDEKLYYNLQDGKQVTMIGQTLKVEVGEEKWSPLVCSYVKMANGRSDMDPSVSRKLVVKIDQDKATEMIGAVMRETSLKLMKDYPDVGEITFHVLDQDSRRGQPKNGIRAECTILKDGKKIVYPAKGVSESLEELSFRNSLNEAFSPIVHLSKLLDEQGLQTIGLQLKTKNNAPDILQPRPPKSFEGDMEQLQNSDKKTKSKMRP